MPPAGIANLSLNIHIKCKRHNIAENNLTRTIFMNLTCVFFETHVYSEFQLKMAMHDRDNEWQLGIIWIFLSPRGKTLPKIIQRKSNSTWTAYFHGTSIYRISIQNVHLWCRKWAETKNNWNFLSQKGMILPKIIRPVQYSKSTCLFSWHIYIPNFNSNWQFVMQIMSGNWTWLEFKCKG